MWTILGEQLGVTQGISARLCDKVIVSFYYFFALQKKKNNKLFFFFIFENTAQLVGSLFPNQG